MKSSYETHPIIVDDDIRQWLPRGRTDGGQRHARRMHDYAGLTHRHRHRDSGVINWFHRKRYPNPTVAESIAKFAPTPVTGDSMKVEYDGINIIFTRDNMQSYYYHLIAEHLGRPVINFELEQRQMPTVHKCLT